MTFKANQNIITNTNYIVEKVAEKMPPTKYYDLLSQTKRMIEKDIKKGNVCEVLTRTELNFAIDYAKEKNINIEVKECYADYMRFWRIYRKEE